MSKKTVYSRESLVAVVEAYLKLKGWDHTEIAKNQNMWGRWIKEADRLLVELKGRNDLAVECLSDLSTKWSAFTNWTISGAANRAIDWLCEKQATQRLAVK